MQQKQREFLYSLLEAVSPSGFEQSAQKIVREYAKTFAEDVRTDVHGNVIALLNPNGRLRLMLAGHVDEIGLMITHVDEQGYLSFRGIGGHDQLLAAGMAVTVFGKKGPVSGVIGKKPTHLMREEDRKKPPEHREMWIDIGAKDGKEAGRLVAVGDIAVYRAGVLELQGSRLAARGLDDRIGVFVIMEALRLLKEAGKKLKDVAVFSVSTVQEELGLRGARTSAFGIDPHVGIAVDVGFAADFPTADKKEVGDVKLGKGPLLHRGANINPVVEKLLAETAKKEKIATQMSATPVATGTDANAIQISRTGVAAGLISIPNRYMHTPVEVVDLKDVENAARLLAAFALRISPDVSFTPL